MKISKLILKTFAKVVAIPPRLKLKNPKPVDNKTLNPLYNLLKSEKLSENKNETYNSIEKITYEQLILSASKKLLDNYYKIYDIEQEKNIENLFIFMNESLSVKEINLFIAHLNEAKNIIDSSNIEKNEKIFTMFLDKLFILTERKNINEHLINIISNISLKNLNPNSIFSFSSTQIKTENTDIDNSIYFLELDKSLKSNMQVSNPILNDFENPLNEYKDAFILKNQYVFNYPLIVQKKNSLTKFDGSNYVIFNHMPFFFPLKNNETQEVEMKHLSNEIIIKNGISIHQDEIYKTFVSKYLKKAFSSNFDNIDIDIFGFYNMRNNDRLESSIMEENIVSETLELYENLKDDLKIIQNERHSQKDYNPNHINIEDIINDKKYLHYRILEIEKEIQKHYKANIFCSGLLKFDTYEEKIDFLTSSVGYFGLYVNGQNIKFLDADFANYLSIQQVISEDFQLEELLKYLNIQLKAKNYNGQLLEIPNYINDNISFDSLKKNKTVYIRFNSFSNAITAYKIFKLYPFRKIVYSKLITPIIRFYDDTFLSGFDLVLKNTITDFEKLLQTKSDYGFKKIAKAKLL